MFSKAARIACCASLLVFTSFAVSPLAFAQDADAKLAEYSALLKRIENLRLSTAQREAMIETQNQQIESLTTQIEQVPETTAAVKDIALKMSAEIEKQIEQDLPFRLEERNARLGDLIELVNDREATGSQIFRRALGVIEIEANYGNAISAYIGDHPLNPGRRLKACQEDIESATCNLSKDTREKIDNGANLSGDGTLNDVSGEVKDGNYVHFGRMSFAYLDLDSREGFRYDAEAKNWVPLNSTEILNVRRAIRVAKGESAPAVVTGPVQIRAAQ